MLGATPQQRNNRMLAVGGLLAAIGVYWYATRSSGIDNVGQAASHTGAAVGRSLEDVGKGFQAKK